MWLLYHLEIGYIKYICHAKKWSKSQPTGHSAKKIHCLETSSSKGKWQAGMTKSRVRRRVICTRRAPTPSPTLSLRNSWRKRASTPVRATLRNLSGSRRVARNEYQRARARQCKATTASSRVRTRRWNLPHIRSMIIRCLKTSMSRREAARISRIKHRASIITTNKRIRCTNRSILYTRSQT